MKRLSSLNCIEIQLLKSLATGLGAVATQNVLSLNGKEYNELKTKVFVKLGVNNEYFAVLKAFRCKLLDAKEFCPETIKAAALSFAHNKTQNNGGFCQQEKFDLWVLYDLLVEFEGFLHSRHFSEILNPNKNPTEAGLKTDRLRH